MPTYVEINGLITLFVLTQNPILAIGKFADSKYGVLIPLETWTKVALCAMGQSRDEKMIYVEETELVEQIDYLLDRINEGEEIAITRSGKIVARLLPCDGTE